MRVKVALWSSEELEEDFALDLLPSLEEEKGVWFQVTDIKQYLYCPRIVYFAYVQPLPAYKPPKVEEGQVAYQELKTRLLRHWPRALPRGQKVLLDVPLIYTPWRLTGRVDALVLQDEETAVVVDFKHARRVLPGWKLQVVAYGMLVEQVLGYKVPEGYIYLTRVRKARRVVLRPALRRQVMAIQKAMRAMLEQNRWPEGPSGRGPCVSCEYRRFCNDRF